jgi:hypothetical protein
MHVIYRGGSPRKRIAPVASQAMASNAMTIHDTAGLINGLPMAVAKASTTKTVAWPICSRF